jgi:hypothetical protein
MVERFQVVPFPVTFVDLAEGEAPTAVRRQRDNGLKQRFLADQQGLLRWLVAGAVAWYATRDLKRNAPEKQGVRAPLLSTAGQDRVVHTREVRGERMRIALVHRPAWRDAMACHACRHAFVLGYKQATYLDGFSDDPVIPLSHRLRLLCVRGDGRRAACGMTAGYGNFCGCQACTKGAGFLHSPKYDTLRTCIYTIRLELLVHFLPPRDGHNGARGLCIDARRPSWHSIDACCPRWHSQGARWQRVSSMGSMGSIREQPDHWPSLAVCLYRPAMYRPDRLGLIAMRPQPPPRNEEASRVSVVYGDSPHAHASLLADR